MKQNNILKNILSYLCQRLQFVFHNWTKTITKRNINELNTSSGYNVNKLIFPFDACIMRQVNILNEAYEVALILDESYQMSFIVPFPFSSTHFILLRQLVSYQVKSLNYLNFHIWCFIVYEQCRTSTIQSVKFLLVVLRMGSKGRFIWYHL